MLRPSRFSAVLVLVAGAGLLAPPGSAAVPEDVTPPVVAIEGRKFVVGAQITPASDDPDDFCPATIAPMDLYWSGSDDESGIAGYRVSDQWGSASPGYWDVVVAGTTQTTARTSADDWDCTTGGNPPHFFRVTAQDNAGNTASSVLDFYDIGAWQEDGTSPNSPFPLTVATTGTWQSDSCSCYDAGHTTYSTASGASISFTTNTWRHGRWVAVVMPRDVDRGEVRIAVDQRAPVTVDTYAAQPQDATVVWQHRFTKRGTHTITLTNVGTVGRSRIDVDSILQTWD